MGSLQVSTLRRAGLWVIVSAVLAACAGTGLHEPVRVNLADLESLPGAGMEARFLAKIRVQNPNDVSIAYSGLSAEIDLNGKSFASGVSDAEGEIPRFGESVIEIPLTVPVTAIVRQVLGLVSGDLSKASYRVRGFLNTGTFGRASFDSTGEIELPVPSSK
jgi:LEA14-like dessication related protein